MNPPPPVRVVAPHRPAKRVLEPNERIAEVLFGLIMVLTFTGSLNAAEAGEAEVRTMLLGALGCNLAWGLIDAVFYLMACLAERGQALEMLRAVRATADPSKARSLIAAALPQPVAEVIEPEELDAIHRRIRLEPEPPQRTGWRLDDFRGAVGVFFLVFLSTFPVVVPFLVLDDAHVALRASHTVAIALLFMAGRALGKHAGLPPVRTGLVMVVVGVALVGVTMALGG